MQTSQTGVSNPFGDNSGFSLIEIIIVIALLSIMTVTVAPRIASYFGNQRRNISIMTAVVTKCFDDAFIKKRTNFMAVHLVNPSAEIQDAKNSEIMSRTNGISVLNIDESGLLYEIDTPSLRSREFPETFTLDKVILPDGREVIAGTVLIPFYPDGYSDNFIIHITSNNDQLHSIVVVKFMKEPYVMEDHVDFETMWENGLM